MAGLKGRRWEYLRRQVLHEERRRCRLCGLPGFEVDHIRSRHAGGSWWGRHNLQVLCKLCHQRKTRKENMDPERYQWRKYLESLSILTGKNENRSFDNGPNNEDQIASK